MFFQQGIFLNLAEKTFPRNIKSISKGLEIYVFGIVEYSFRSECLNIIALRDQAYCVPGSPKYFCIIYLQGICTSEGFKGTLIAHYHDEHNSYAELSLK